MRPRINQKALTEATEFLEITKPVHIQFDASFRTVNGKYYGLKSRPHRGSYRSQWPERRHLIVLDPDVSAESVNRTLWHELTHASQLERYDTPGEFFAAYGQEERGLKCRSKASVASIDRYRTISFEVEANEYGELGETDPLFLPSTDETRLP